MAETSQQQQLSRVPSILLSVMGVPISGTNPGMGTVDEIQSFSNIGGKPGPSHANLSDKATRQFADLPVDILRMIIGQVNSLALVKGGGHDWANIFIS